MIDRILRLAACLALLSLAACDRDRGPGTVSEAELLNVYEVPAARLQEVQRALKQAGVKASTVPPDRLLVRAPITLQASIRATVESLAAPSHDAPPPTPEVPVRLTVWIVDAAGADAPHDPALGELQAALDPVASSLGVSGFRLRARLSSDAQGIDIYLNVNAGREMGINSQTRLRYGELVVLAQGMPQEQGVRGVRLILVRADRAG